MNVIFFIGALILCSIIAMILGLCSAEEIPSDLKDKLIDAYGEKWYMAEQLCNSEGWIPYYDYHDSFPQDYKVKTINGTVCYRPKLKK